MFVFLVDLALRFCKFQDGSRHFPMPVAGIKTPLKLDKFVMATASHNAQDSVKCVVTVLGDNLTNAVWSMDLESGIN